MHLNSTVHAKTDAGNISTHYHSPKQHWTPISAYLTISAKQLTPRPVAILRQSIRAERVLAHSHPHNPHLVHAAGAGLSLPRSRVFDNDVRGHRQ